MNTIGCQSAWYNVIIDVCDWVYSTPSNVNAALNASLLSFGDEVTFYVCVAIVIAYSLVVGIFVELNL